MQPDGSVEKSDQDQFLAFHAKQTDLEGRRTLSAVVAESITEDLRVLRSSGLVDRVAELEDENEKLRERIAIMQEGNDDASIG